jgi:hypothetical protein
MTRALRHQVTVQPGGRIEVQSADLKAGQSAEVIVLVEESANGRPNASFFGSGRGAFASPAEADRFLSEERDGWRG